MFHRALELAESAREAEVLSWAGGDRALAREVLQLLEADSSVQVKIESSVTDGVGFPEGSQEDEGPDSWIGRVLGSYQLREVLGRGGMGIVYQADRVEAAGVEASSPRQPVAVKLVRRNLQSSPAVAHFLLERDALARLEHPGIARLLDGGVTAEGLPFVVMEYVEGQRIDKACDEPGTSIETVLGYTLQLCAAVTYVHRNLILHRDLKPGNILLTNSGTVKLLDFGTLKLIGPDASASPMTEAGMRPVTLRYASPEHIAGGPVSAASDVYSLGMTLYRLIAGRLPEEMETLPTSEYLERLREGRIQPPSSRSTRRMPQEMARDLDAIVMKAIRFEPERRYPAAEALAAELTRALEKRPVEARGDSRRYRAGKFYARNRATFWAAVAIAAVLAVGAVAMVRQARVARDEKARAELGVAKERQLVHLLLFDYFTQLQQIPGSTQAERHAVSEAVAYLDRLETTTPSPDVKLESVRAYTAMGALLGSPYYQNLGDAPGAIKTMNKALPVAEELVRRDPQNAACQQTLANLQMTLGQVYMGMGEPKRALAYLQPASDTAWALANRPNADLKTVLAATTPLGLLGDDYSQRGNGTLRDPAKATEIYGRVRDLNARAVALDPGCAKCKRGLAIAYTKLGQLSEEHDTDAALADYKRGLDLLNSLAPADQAKAPMQRSFGILRLALISVYLYTGQKAPAEQLLTAERDSSLKAIAADPTDARARFDLAALDSTVMDAYMAVHDYPDALRSSSQFLDSTVTLVRLQPKNVTWNILHATALLYHGKALRETGSKAAGEAEVSQGLDLLLPLTSDADAEPDTLGTASQFLVYLGRNPVKNGPLAVTLAQRAMAGGGTPSSDQLLLLSEALRFAGETSQSKDSARVALAILQTTPKGLGHKEDVVQATDLLRTPPPSPH